MSSCEASLDTSDLYHTALDSLMDSLHINSTPKLEFFTRCSTIEKFANSQRKDQEKAKHIQIVQISNDKQTPKRSMPFVKKQRLFPGTPVAIQIRSQSGQNQQQRQVIIENVEKIRSRPDQIISKKKPSRACLRVIIAE
uniref:Uncharacterized protein n=1 Tax=Glossina austeni TaxID=7395 RepID=A0A1A9VKV8_GLOAU